MAGLDFGRHDGHRAPRTGYGDVEVEARGTLAIGAGSLHIAGEQAFEDDDFIELLPLRLMNGHHGHALLGASGGGELVLNYGGGQQGSGIFVAAESAPSLGESGLDVGAAPQQTHVAGFLRERPEFVAAARVELGAYGPPIRHGIPGQLDRRDAGQQASDARADTACSETV